MRNYAKEKKKEEEEGEEEGRKEGRKEYRVTGKYKRPMFVHVPAHRSTLMCIHTLPLEKRYREQET